MAVVISTRCTYAAHAGLPELPGGHPVVLEDDLLPLALTLPGVVDASPSAPVEHNPVPDLPEESWENDFLHHETTSL